MMETGKLAYFFFKKKGKERKGKNKQSEKCKFSAWGEVLSLYALRVLMFGWL
jgi:hypothetical protein